MLNLVLLAGIAYLIARVIWNIIGRLEELYFWIRQRTSLPSPGSSTILPSIPTQSNIVSSSQPSSIVPPPSTKVSAKEKPIQLQVLESVQKQQDSSTVVKNQFIAKQKQDSKPSVAQKVPDVKKSGKNRFAASLQQIQMQDGNAEQRAVGNENTIAELRQEIQRYHLQKQMYVQRIQEIIQHVKNQTELQEEESRNSTEDQELSAINNLKLQLNTVNAKFHQQKEQISLTFQKQKEQLIQKYQLEIHELKISNINQTKFYEQQIDQIRSRLVQMSEDKGINGPQSSSQPLKFQQQSNNFQQIQQKNRTIQRLQQERNFLSQNLQEYTSQQQKLTHQRQSLIRQREELVTQAQKLSKELKNVKEELGKSQNDQIELQSQHQAQINSLKAKNAESTQQLQRYFRLQQQLEQIKFKLQTQQIQAQNNYSQDNKSTQNILELQDRIKKITKSKEQAQSKLLEAQQELNFCQQQLKNARQTEADLRDKLVKALQSPKKSQRSFVKKQDVEKHPQYLKLKRRLQQVEGKRSSPEQIARQAQIAPNSAISPREQRELSPSFPNLPIPANINTNKKTYSPTEERGNYKSNIYQSGATYQSAFKVPVGLNSLPPASTIYGDRRAMTPFEKPVAASTIMEGGILGQPYLGETQILNQSQRNFIMHEVSALKKITAKKTRLMYTSRQKVNKSIIQYILGAPNIILIAELQSKKIVGAFTQNAFSKENKFTKSSVVSKAMIFDVSNQIFITNEGKGEIIHCEENSLIWGNNEFVIHCVEPISLSINLNCENAVYPSAYSSKDFINSQENAITISKFEVHRVFLG